MRGTAAFLLALYAALASAPAESPPLHRIAFGSCNREYRPQTIWKAIRDFRPDVWIWLGDVVYGTATNLPDLKRRYDTQKNSADYSALRQHCRVIGTWDDNDYGVSDGGKENPHKAESQKLLLDFLDEPADSPRRKQAGIYDSYVFGSPGQRVKIVLLDGRYFREKPGKNSDMLGPEQWRWLEQQLTDGDADVNIIGSGIQVIADEHPFEKWSNFPRSRERLFDVIARSGTRNVIFISGDRHLGEISRLSDPRIPYPLYDITSSGLTHHAKDNWLHNYTHEVNHHRVGMNYVGLNFGTIDFDWAANPATATLQVHDVSGAVKVEQKVTLAPR